MMNKTTSLLMLPYHHHHKTVSLLMLPYHHHHKTVSLLMLPYHQASAGWLFYDDGDRVASAG
jgi:hypothetical protein